MVRGSAICIAWCIKPRAEACACHRLATEPRSSAEPSAAASSTETSTGHVQGLLCNRDWWGCQRFGRALDLGGNNGNS
jgi:hypothetical protein